MTVLIATICLFYRITFSVIISSCLSNKNWFSLHKFVAFSLQKGGNNEKENESWQPLQQKQEEHPRNGQSRNTSVPRINEKYITQVSEEIEGTVTKKLSQEFNRTESGILCALSNLDELLLNPQIRTHSGTVPGTFRNKNVENQEPNEDRSQDDPHPEVGPYQSRHSNDSDLDEAPQNSH